MSRPVITTLGALAAALLTALAVAGCGGSDPVRLERPSVRVDLSEYAIAPQEISVPAGRVELVARNAGRLTHNLRVERSPSDPEEAAEPLATTPTAMPGGTVRVAVTLRPGTYRLRCTLGNHDDLGETGELIVR
jgi:uncharacterized cupredoxin-like copper-binding protein